VNWWWWIPVGLAAWLLVGLAVGLGLGPVLRRSSEVGQQLTKSDGHRPSRDERQACLPPTDDEDGGDPSLGRNLRVMPHEQLARRDAGLHAEAELDGLATGIRWSSA
jgi:hypothetical protein